MLNLGGYTVGMRIHFEKITYEVGAPLLVREVKEKLFSAPLHVHPELELTLIVESSGKRFVGDSIEDFESGDLVLVGGNLPHFWSNDEMYSHDKGSDALAIVVQFDASFLGPNFMKLSGAQHIEKLLQSSNLGICIINDTRDILSQKMVTLQHMDTFGKVLTLLEMLDILAKSKDYYFLASPGFKPYLNASDCQKMNKIYAYVYQHINGKLDIVQIADLLNMSISAFCHYFKKRTQKTFTQFVNEIRIGNAKRLLIESDKSISEIGYECGYNSISNFNKQFSTITGLAPRAFRERYFAGFD